LRLEGILGDKRHKRAFGDFGIVFKGEWVYEKQFRPVVYVKEGSKLHMHLKLLFADAEKELIDIIKQRPPDDAFPYMSYTNRNVASQFGASKYCKFLSIYEMLEPGQNSWQREWRAVQKMPLYNEGSTQDFIKSISVPSWDNIVMTLKFKPENVSHFVAKLSNRIKLKACLPEEYKDKDVCWKMYT